MPIQERDLPLRFHATRRPILSAQLEHTQRESSATTHVHDIAPEMGARGRESRLTRRRAQRATTVGRAGLIWLAAYVFSIHALPPGLALASAAAVSAVWYAALQHLTATRAAVVQLLVPILAAGGAAAWLGEVPSTRLVLSSAAILGGVALTIRDRTVAVA